MTRWIGEGGLVLAAALAGVGVLAGLVAWRRGRGAGLARGAVLAQPLAIGAAVVALMGAFVRDDMSLSAVVLHSERALPPAYKLAAVWAGQEGSLLLWALVLSAAGAIAALRTTTRLETAGPVVHAVFSGLVLFFCLLMLGAADPFALDPRGPIEDGVGLSPMLQHWAMVVHPPMLFTGYACAATTFSIALGGLAVGDLRPEMLASMRRWALASWGFLGAGILLGAWWAYVELGWGGYWAWDPVENASLMPWLAVTGLLHSLLVARERGSLRGWAAALACLAFALCVLGTTLTRSGLLVSVHAFGATTVGAYLLGLLGFIVGGSGWLLWRRRAALRTEREVGGVLSRDGAVVVLNLLLCAMLVATLAGTLVPVVSGLAFGQQVSLGAPYYNRVVGSLGLAAACVMALGPVLSYDAGGRTLRRALPAPGALGLAAVLGAAALGVRKPAALVCVLIAVVTPGVIGIALAHGVRARRPAGDGWLAAAWRTLASQRRRYAGQLAHAGLCLLLIGVCGSGLYADRAERTMSTGDSAQIGRYRVEYRGLREVRGPNYSAMEAELVAGDRGGRATTLRPQRRYYDRAMDPVSEVAVRQRASGDLYVVLAGWTPGETQAAFVLVTNPLAVWIWIGGGVMAAGGFLAWLPSGRRGANNGGGAPAELAAGPAPDGISRAQPGPQEGSVRP